MAEDETNQILLACDDGSDAHLVQDDTEPAQRNTRRVYIFHFWKKSPNWYLVCRSDDSGAMHFFIRPQPQIVGRTFAMSSAIKKATNSFRGIRNTKKKKKFLLLWRESSQKNFPHQVPQQLQAQAPSRTTTMVLPCMTSILWYALL